MAEIISIADAVVSALNSEAFQAELDEEFEAVRKYLPRFDLKDMATLHVTVAPKAIETETASRDKAVYDYKIDVGVQKRYEKEDAETIDPLVSLVEQIADLFRLKKLEEYAAAMWIKTEHPAVYHPEHMEQFHQFTSVITFTFRVIR